MSNSKNFAFVRYIIFFIITMFFSGIIFIAGCSEVLAKNEPVQIAPEKVYEILKDQAQKNKYTILDVRTIEEFDMGHLDSAVLIPVDDLEARFGELDKNKPVIVYCRSGRRSAKAAAILVSNGFSSVYDMTGGIDAWTGSGYPVYVENAGGISSEITSLPADQVSGQDSGQSSALQSEDSDSAVDTAATMEVRYITADELNTKVNQGEEIVILDVRSEDSYAVKHIKGAINIPFTEFESRSAELVKSSEIIIYCSDNDCGLSANAFTLLTNSGFKNVSALKGGIEDWTDKGYPVE